MWSLGDEKQMQIPALCQIVHMLVFRPRKLVLLKFARHYHVTPVPYVEVLALNRHIGIGRTRNDPSTAHATRALQNSGHLAHTRPVGVRAVPSPMPYVAAWRICPGRHIGIGRTRNNQHTALQRHNHTGPYTEQRPFGSYKAGWCKGRTVANAQ